MKNVERVMNTDKFQIARNAILNENMDYVGALTMQMAFKLKFMK